MESTPKGSAPATLSTIADALGLSINTVSRALRGVGSIREDTRASILAEAARVGYVPNRNARSLANGVETTIGLVITNPSNPFYAELISSVEQASRSHGFSVLLMVTEDSTASEAQAAQVLLGSRVSGAIVVSTQDDDQPWGDLVGNGSHIVAVNRPLAGVNSDFVGIDYESGAYEATKHLLSVGRRHIRLIEEDLAVSTVAQRIRGFERAIRELSGDSDGTADTIKVPTPRRSDNTLPWSLDDAYTAALRLFDETDGPLAINTGTDYIALAVLAAARERGLRVPQDVAVCGRGDYPFAGYSNPTLSTVRSLGAEVGTKAAEILFQRIGSGLPTGRRTKRRSVMFEPELVVRESTVAPPPRRRAAAAGVRTRTRK